MRGVLFEFEYVWYRKFNVCVLAINTHVCGGGGWDWIGLRDTGIIAIVYNGEGNPLAFEDNMWA